MQTLQPTIVYHHVGLFRKHIFWPLGHVTLFVRVPVRICTFSAARNYGEDGMLMDLHQQLAAGRDATDAHESPIVGQRTHRYR
jgi:hypothetical protein